MAMAKSELEFHWAEYHRLLNQAIQHKAAWEIRSMIETALLACDFIDGMMQKERKQGNKEVQTVLAMDLILQYAPMLLDVESLARLGVIIKAYRRIERDTTDDMTEKLAQANGLLWKVQKLIGHIETHLVVNEFEAATLLEVFCSQALSILKTWEALQFIRRIHHGNPAQYSLWTLMDENTSAKCSGCGFLATAKKAAFLSNFKCDKCGELAVFVLVGAAG